MSVTPVNTGSHVESYKPAAVPQPAVNASKSQQAIPQDKVTLSPASQAQQQPRTSDADHDGNSK